SELEAHIYGQVREGCYRYTDDLLALEGYWTKCLANHPDTQFASYIQSGIQSGFRIGFNRHSPLLSASSNMACSNPEVIHKYLAREVSLGRMFTRPPQSDVHISPLGIIPKKNKPGKWRLIVDLSSPHGQSVNDGIDTSASSLRYPTVDDLASLIVRNGRGAFIVKADIKEAYRNIPIHPDDYGLLGVQWNGTVFVDKFLPFGLRSAPKIFSAVADAAQWVLTENGVRQVLHYLDDFALVERNQATALESKITLCSVFGSLGLPLEPSKLEGPTTCLTFLGIEVDTVSLQLRLPTDKLDRLLNELKEVQGRKVISKRELQSLTGLLQHACKVVRPGRAFLQRLYALEKVGSAPDHHIRLNVAARADVMWWQLFVSHWNGVSMLCDPKHSKADIQVKELIPVVIAAALFGRSWRGKLIVFSVDNQAVVHILNNTHSKESHLMHLIRLLAFYASYYDFWFRAEHIPG
uniref:Reverse transcriptase domain-containing protein n=1 Tax=Amphimedon queenslandica TaxID=400682 RepID=A0A1X7TP25_AMPQE